MTFSKAFIYTTLLMFSNFTLAAQLFNPMDEYQKQEPQNKKVNKGFFEKHQAQGAFPYDIPDDDTIGIDIPIDMTGQFNGDIISLAIQIEIEHTFIRDLEITLTSPDGLAHLVLLSRVGLELDLNTGDANLNGLYTFVDVDSNLGLTNDLWSTASLLGDNDDVPTAVYRTSTEGKVNNNFGGCTTRMDGAFSGLTPDQSNGVWALHVADHAAQDTGTISSATILYIADTDSIFKSPFEAITAAPYVPLPASDILGTCQKAQYDFTGTGLSDYVVSWQNNENNLTVQMISNEGATTGAEESFEAGPFADTEMTSGGDFDGDGIKDFVFKRPLNDEAFQYLIRRSSRPDDLPISIGIAIPPADATIDLQIGDYDGDGLDDFAFYVSNDVTELLTGLSIFQSSNLSNRQIATTDGITSDFSPSGGFDHNGDQIADLILFTSDGDLNDPLFIITAYDGSDGTLIYDSKSGIFRTQISVIPGTFIDSSTIDISLYNPPTLSFDSYDIANFISEDFFTSPTANITVVTGDYDGDGVDDFGYWDINNAQFVIRPSGSFDPDNNLIGISPAGSISSDSPLANIRIR